MLSSYKDHSSLLRWQANFFVPLYNYGTASMKVYCDFGVLALFYCWWPYFIVCSFNITIRVANVSFCCLCLACRAWSGYESAGPLWAWMGTKVLDTLRACVKIADCCDPSFAGILTCVKMLVTVLRAFCHCIWMIHNSGLSSFVLLRMIRSSLHCIKPPDQRSLIIMFKSHNPRYPSLNHLWFHFIVIR
jgi:hypothetical protein